MKSGPVECLAGSGVVRRKPGYFLLPWVTWLGLESELASYRSSPSFPSTIPPSSVRDGTNEREKARERKRERE